MIHLVVLCFFVQVVWTVALTTESCPADHSITLQDFERKHPVQQLRMLMTPKERILLLSYLNTSTNYFEFGAGGSTELACSLENVKKVVSSEGSSEFLNSLVDRSPCLKTKKFVPNYIDIGPVGNWTVPLDKTTKQKLRLINPSVQGVEARGRSCRWKVQSSLCFSDSPNDQRRIHSNYIGS